MSPDNGSRYGTPFTVSIEARDGVTTGVSAADRVTTIRAAIAPNAKPADLVRPGHVFPLRAAPGGGHDRHGGRQSEGARTGDDQYSNGRNQRISECRRGAPHGPGNIRNDGDTDDDRHEYTGHRVGKLLYGRTRALGVRHHLDNLAE